MRRALDFDTLAKRNPDASLPIIYNAGILHSPVLTKPKAKLENKTNKTSIFVNFQFCIVVRVFFEFIHNLEYNGLITQLQ